MAKAESDRSRRGNPRDVKGRRPRNKRPVAPPAPRHQSDRRRIIEGCAVFLVAVAAYANTVNSDFTLDDVPIVKENELIRSLDAIGRFFTTNYWGDKATLNDKSLYRPLTITSYALNYAVNGLSPRGYHVVNIVLHAGVCVLLYALVLALFRDARMALISGVLFAVHPIHTEVVAGIVGRAEILALFGGLMCCLSYLFATREESPVHRRRGWAWVAISVFSYAFAMFSKEIGFMAPVLILLWEAILPAERRLFRANSRAIVAFVGFGIAAGLYLFIRSAVVRTNNINIGFVGVSTVGRVSTALRVCMEYVGLLVAPIRLSADYWIKDVPIAKGLTDVLVLGALLLLALLIVIMIGTWRRRPAAAWGIGVFLAVLFPVSNLGFRIGVLKAERILYSPSVGFIVALAAVATTLYARTAARRSASAAIWLVAVLFLARTWARNEDWRDNHNLAEVTLKTSPSSSIFNTIMATWYRQNKQNGPAREHLLRSLESQPKNTTALFNLGNVELDERRFDAAIDYYHRALAIQPEYVSALNNLGRALAESGRLKEAVGAYERSLQARADNPPAYANLLSVYVQLKDWKAAVPLAEEAQRRYPKIAVIQLNAASVYRSAGHKTEADAAFRRALELDPKILEQGDIETPMD